ncbi:hypothetical protein E2562_021551 [Oryza meyeriana var. granulata]|uniref:Uncharacterized protein n=1 Tax=Oryza meyeriana var. granulata TaxID=110450 RepID=A0A6G1EXP6_9ORYZ|nr:hypothetical protein E2562_021551 [Oryza meyeriana var. granulata]
MDWAVWDGVDGAARVKAELRDSWARAGRVAEQRERGVFAACHGVARRTGELVVWDDMLAFEAEQGSEVTRLPNAVGTWRWLNQLDMVRRRGAAAWWLLVCIRTSTSRARRTASKRGYPS